MATVTVQIKRPAGNIETVDISKHYMTMTAETFAIIVKNTAEAGRGQVLSYSVDGAISAERTISAEQKAEIADYDKKCAWFKQQGFSASDVS